MSALGSRATSAPGSVDAIAIGDPYKIPHPTAAYTGRPPDSRSCVSMASGDSSGAGGGTGGSAGAAAGAGTGTGAGAGAGGAADGAKPAAAPKLVWPGQKWWKLRDAPKSDGDRAVRMLFAGGAAGAVAKTSVAPLERVKLLCQVRHGSVQQCSDRHTQRRCCRDAGCVGTPMRVHVVVVGVLANLWLRERRAARVWRTLRSLV